MALLKDDPELNLYDDSWRIFSRNPNKPPHYVAENAKITNSMVSEGCYIYGTVENSVLSAGVIVKPGALVRDSIIMQDTVIGKDSRIFMSMIDEEVQVEDDVKIGGGGAITVIGTRTTIKEGVTIAAGESIPAKRIIRKTAGGDKSC